LPALAEAPVMPCADFSFHHAQSLLTFKPYDGARNFRPVQRSN
jgi:hypothetical protein